MALIDEAIIHIESGSGGNGCISFRREKFVPHGGPNGGNGGRGGHVYIEATRDKSSLLDFKFQPKYKATRGEHGMGSDCDGHAGDDLTIQVPTGTLIYEAGTNELIADLTEHGQTICVAEGGKGGRGNLSFKTSTNRAPRQATPGVPGKELDLKLELQLLADVGLIGLPNAGKSSFLQVVSRARPKIADYPFTTLEPHLGVVAHQDRSFVVADLPGLIEGAAEGAGLGHRFLKHVARNRLLLHLVDLSQDVETIQKAIQVIRKELKDFDATLLEKEEILVFTKTDLFSAEALAEKKTEMENAGFTNAFYLSSKTQDGLKPLLDTLAQRQQQLPV